jgi:hypothetical protein
MRNPFSHIKSWLLSVSLLLWISSFSQKDTSFWVDKDSVNVFDKVNPFQIREVPVRKIKDSMVRNLKKDEAFWYVDLKPEREKKTPRRPTSVNFGNLSWLKPLMWTLIIGSFIAILIWYLSISNIKLFSKAPKKLASEAAQDFAEDIFSVDYDFEIQKAVNEQNFRLAVRLLFLQNLKMLSRKNMIQYETDRTNSDYLRQLFNSAYYKDFFKLTRNFEYTWYGQMPVQADVFNVMKKDFETFNQRLSF